MPKEYLTRTVEEDRGYSRAVVAKGPGTTVYLAGVGMPKDSSGNSLGGDFAAQARGSFEELKDALTEAGGTLDDIVTMTVFITDWRYGHEFLGIRKDYFKAGRYPASALIGVAELALPDMLVEIQATAVIDS